MLLYICVCWCVGRVCMRACIIITDHTLTVLYWYYVHKWMHLIFIGTARSSDLEFCVWSHQCLLTKLLHLTAVQRTGGVRAGRRIPSVSCHIYIYCNRTVNCHKAQNFGGKRYWWIAVYNIIAEKHC